MLGLCWSLLLLMDCHTLNGKLFYGIFIDQQIQWLRERVKTRLKKVINRRFRVRWMFHLTSRRRRSRDTAWVIRDCLNQLINLCESQMITIKLTQSVSQSVSTLLNVIVNVWVPTITEVTLSFYSQMPIGWIYLSIWLNLVRDGDVERRWHLAFAHEKGHGKRNAL